MISESVLAVMVAAAAFYDLRERRIPNWLTMPGLAVGLLLNIVIGGSAGLMNALLGAITGAALLVIPYALGWMGGGDLKLLAAIGAFMGVYFTLSTLIFALAAGGVIALVWLAVKRSLFSSLKYTFLVWLPLPGTKPLALKAPIPFGPALGLGVLVTLISR